MKDHIEISLEWKGKQVDLSVPSNITAAHLTDLLTQAFEKKGQELPKNWHFIVKGKRVALESGLTLKALGLGNGEILQLIVGEKDEII